MKKCPKCNREYDDNFQYCIFDGVLLQQHKSKKSVSIVIGFIAILLVCGLFLLIFSKNREFDESRSQLESAKYRKMFSEYLEENNKPTAKDLRITSDSWRKEGNWVYVTGTVKNTGSQTISYLEIAVDFLDRRGNIVDSDWTNEVDLKPGASRHFEIMHRNDSSFYSYKVMVDDVW